MEEIFKVSKHLKIPVDVILKDIIRVLKKYGVYYQITDMESILLYLYDHLEKKNGSAIVEFEGYTNIFDMKIRGCFKYELKNNTDLIDSIFRLLNKYSIKY